MPWFNYQKLGKSCWGTTSRSLAHSVAIIQKVLTTSVLGDAVTAVAYSEPQPRFRPALALSQEADIR